MNYLLILALLLLTNCGNGSGTGTEPPKPKVPVSWQFSPETLTDFTADGGSQTITITTNTAWKVVSNQTWCTTSASAGYPTSSYLTVTTQKNPTDKERTASLTFTANDVTKIINVKQAAGVGQPGGTDTHSPYVPAGYNLVWWDEFNDARIDGGKAALPDASKWWYETAEKGWVNNELQKYVAGVYNTDTVSPVYDGTLKIIAKKRGADILSARINSKDSWLYGYFEARLKMPSGKGTWPAFWMLPKNFQSWPLDGEIDIMEYVGYEPNVVHATIHTQAYNHSIGTQKGSSKTITNAETEFHIYALEWSAEKIVGYVDGTPYFTFYNDNQNNKSTWPFNAPFYLKLNLAWGGDWGGAQGVDESKLPATYEIDYVRVYQK